MSAQLLWYILALVLVGSAVLARRWTFRGAIGMALAWVGIFAILLIGFSFRQELGLVGARVQSEITGAPRQRTEGKAIRIAMSADGHFWVEGMINTTPTRFLVDSGASITALSETVATQAGLNVDQMRVAVMHTANGPVDARYASVPQLRIGAIKTSDLQVVVSPAFGEINVLGMNFLSQLKGWRVENREMVLEPN
jgi:aspartyl protease family protein